MSKYIDLNEATDLFKGIDATMTGGWVADTLEALPTIDIVRCQDCKYWVYNPSVVLNRTEGEWVYQEYMTDLWTCSACGESIFCDDIECSNYCPNCGAKMKGAE